MWLRFRLVWNLAKFDAVIRCRPTVEPSAMRESWGSHGTDCEYCCVVWCQV